MKPVTLKTGFYDIQFIPSSFAFIVSVNNINALLIGQRTYMAKEK